MSNSLNDISKVYLDTIYKINNDPQIAKNNQERWKEIGGPTPDNYKSTDDSAKLQASEELTPMQDNNLYGNAYAGSIKKKKKKVKEEFVDEKFATQAKDRKKLGQDHSVSGRRRDHSHDVDSALTDHVPRKGKGRVRPASKKEMRVSAMRDSGLKTEAKVDTGKSADEKATARNQRNNPKKGDPGFGKFATSAFIKRKEGQSLAWGKDSAASELRRKAHAAKRGVKEEVGISSTDKMKSAQEKAKKELIQQNAVEKQKKALKKEDAQYGYDKKGRSLNPVDIEKRKRKEDDLFGSPKSHNKSTSQGQRMGGKSTIYKEGRSKKNPNNLVEPKDGVDSAQEVNRATRKAAFRPFNKEQYSHWREELVHLIEVPDDDPVTDTEMEKKVTEKKVNNKIVINPKLATEDKAFDNVVSMLRKKHGKDAVLTKDSPKPKAQPQPKAKPQKPLTDAEKNQREVDARYGRTAWDKKGSLGT